MKTEQEIKQEFKELKIKVKTCFNPKSEESKKYAKGFIDGLGWVLNKQTKK